MGVDMWFSTAAATYRRAIQVAVATAASGAAALALGSVVVGCVKVLF